MRCRQRRCRRRLFPFLISRRISDCVRLENTTTLKINGHCWALVYIYVCVCCGQAVKTKICVTSLDLDSSMWTVKLLRLRWRRRLRRCLAMRDGVARHLPHYLSLCWGSIDCGEMAALMSTSSSTTSFLTHTHIHLFTWVYVCVITKRHCQNKKREAKTGSLSLLLPQSLSLPLHLPLLAALAAALREWGRMMKKKALLLLLLHLKKHKICNGYSSCIGMHSQSLYIYCCLTHSLSRSTYALVQAAAHTHINTRTTHHKRTHAQMVPIRNACMCMCVCVLCMSLPHPRMLPRIHTHIYDPAFEFGFVSVRSRRRLRLAGLFARFGYPYPAAIMSRKHHHRFISFTRTWVKQARKI